MSKSELRLANARLAREDDGLGPERLLRHRLPAEVLEVVQLVMALELLGRQHGLGFLDASSILDHYFEELVIQFLVSRPSLDGFLDSLQVSSLAMSSKDVGLSFFVPIIFASLSVLELVANVLYVSRLLFAFSELAIALAIEDGGLVGLTLLADLAMSRVASVKNKSKYLF